jgi:hypothetical protein
MSLIEGDLNTVKDRYHNREKVGLLEGPKPVPLSAYRARKDFFLAEWFKRIRRDLFPHFSESR